MEFFEFEIRITSWDVEDIIQKICFDVESCYVIAKETGKTGNANEHVHIYLRTTCPTQTIRQRLKRNYKGIYKCSTLRSKEKFFKYISKDWEKETNENIISNIGYNPEHWKAEWLKDGEKLKGNKAIRNQQTRRTIAECIDQFEEFGFDRNKMSDVKKILNICIRNNGLAPQKHYFNQIVNTVHISCGFEDEKREDKFVKHYMDRFEDEADFKIIDSDEESEDPEP